MNGNRIRLAGGPSRRRCARAASSGAPGEQAAAQQRQRQQGDVLHDPASPRRERSATMRTSMPGSASMSWIGSGSREAAQAAPPGRRAHHHVGRAAVARDAAAPPRRRRPCSTSRCAPSTDGQPPQRVELLALLARTARARAARPRGGRGRRRGAAPSATRAARRAGWTGCGLDEREQALADGLRRRGRDQALLADGADAGDQPLGLDLLGDLAQRDLAQGGEVLDLEEAVERGRRRARAGRSCPRAGGRSAPRA